MNFPATIQTKITPEKAQKILQDNGMQVNLDQAKSILEFLLILAQSTQHANSRSVHPGKHGGPER